LAECRDYLISASRQAAGAGKRIRDLKCAFLVSASSTKAAGLPSRGPAAFKAVSLYLLSPTDRRCRGVVAAAGGGAHHLRVPQSSA